MTIEAQLRKISDYREEESSLPQGEKNMKSHKFLLIVLFLAIPVFVAGCKYKVTEPLWNQPYTTPPSPTITSIDPPSEAKAGVNTITIHGHNLVVSVPDTLTPDSTVVYFGSVAATIINADSSSIVVNRPNTTGTDTIKVVPHNAISVATYGPYTVDAVVEQYGGFLQNLQLGAIAVDNSENLYVMESIKKLVHKVTPDGNNVVLGGGTLATSFQPFDASIGPDGNLYVTENNRSIDSINVGAETRARWVQMPSGKVVRFGDFDTGGHFYTGGVRTDLCILPPNPSTSSSGVKFAGSYATDEILAIRVYGGYVYVASQPYGTQDPATIWRNQILSDGVGPREKVLDMSATQFGAVPITGLAFSSTGTMVIATHSQYPLLMVDQSSGAVTEVYRGIIPAYGGGIAWSKSSTYLYLITGDTDTGQTWTVYRVDMGITGGK